MLNRSESVDVGILLCWCFLFPTEPAGTRLCLCLSLEKHHNFVAACCKAR